MYAGAVPRTTTPTRDPYRRRREAGAASREDTRRRLLEAADVLFRQQGYPTTTVAAIAASAQVSVQTLYLAWGSKRALFKAAADAAAVAEPLPVEPERWRATVTAELAEAAGDDPDAAAYLAAVSRLFVQVAERTAPYWRMLRQAAATDPEIAADWDANGAARRRTMEQVARGVPRRGRRPRLSDDDLADALWVLASHETHDLLTVQRRQSPADYQAWLERTLVAACCADRPVAHPTCSEQTP